MKKPTITKMIKIYKDIGNMVETQYLLQSVDQKDEIFETKKLIPLLFNIMKNMVKEGNMTKTKIEFFNEELTRKYSNRGEPYYVLTTLLSFEDRNKNNIENDLTKNDIYIISHRLFNIYLNNYHEYDEAYPVRYEYPSELDLSKSNEEIIEAFENHRNYINEKYPIKPQLILNAYQSKYDIFLERARIADEWDRINTFAGVEYILKKYIGMYKINTEILILLGNYILHIDEFFKNDIVYLRKTKNYEFVECDYDTLIELLVPLRNYLYQIEITEDGKEGKHIPIVIELDRRKGE